jgi:hypothetical protein
VNVEEQELATDSQWRVADELHRGDMYDAVQDARSKARYEETEHHRMSEAIEAARRTP